MEKSEGGRRKERKEEEEKLETETLGKNLVRKVNSMCPNDKSIACHQNNISNLREGNFYLV